MKPIKIYMVEYMDYDASYIVASYTNKKAAEIHALTNPKRLQVIEDNLYDNYDQFREDKTD